MAPSPYTYEVDIGHRPWAVAPAMEGRAFDVTPDSARITGVRALPPSFDVHAYKERRSEKREAETSATPARNVARDFRRDSTNDSNTVARGRQSEGGKNVERKGRRRKLESETRAKHLRVFEARMARGHSVSPSDDVPPDDDPSDKPPPPLRPAADFGMLAVAREMPQHPPTIAIPTPPPEVNRARKTEKAWRAKEKEEEESDAYETSGKRSKKRGGPRKKSPRWLRWGDEGGMGLCDLQKGGCGTFEFSKAVKSNKSNATPLANRATFAFRHNWGC